MNSGFLLKEIFVPCLINEGVEYAMHDKDNLKIFFKTNKEAVEFVEKTIKKNANLRDREIKIFVYKRVG